MKTDVKDVPLVSQRFAKWICGKACGYDFSEEKPRGCIVILLTPKNPYAETCMSLFPFLATVVCKKDITRERPTWLYRGFIRANWVVAYHTPSEEDIAKRVCLWFRLKWICGKACGYDFGMRLWLCRRKNIAHGCIVILLTPRKPYAETCMSLSCPFHILSLQRI